MVKRFDVRESQSCVITSVVNESDYNRLAVLAKELAESVLYGQIITTASVAEKARTIMKEL